MTKKGACFMASIGIAYIGASVVFGEVVFSVVASRRQHSGFREGQFMWRMLFQQDAQMGRRHVTSIEPHLKRSCRVLRARSWMLLCCYCYIDVVSSSPTAMVVGNRNRCEPKWRRRDERNKALSLRLPRLPTCVPQALICCCAASAFS